MSRPAKEKIIVVLNRSSRRFTTTQGNLDKNGTISLPEEEAKSLIADYPLELIDASKFLPATSREQDLEKENEELKKENAELRKQIKGYHTKEGD